MCGLINHKFITPRLQLSKKNAQEAADVYFHFKLNASFHKHNIFLVSRVIIKTYKELETHAKRTFPFSVSCKTDLPNYRKKSGCCTAELKTFRSISNRLVTHQANPSVITYMKDTWHYRLFHRADRHTRVNTGQPKHATKGFLYSPGILPLLQNSGKYNWVWIYSGNIYIYYCGDLKSRPMHFKKREKYILAQSEIIGPKWRSSQMKSMACNT